MTGRTPWVGGWTPSSVAAVRLFCFPHAGGSASAFEGWLPRFPASIDVCSVHVPGRGRRWREAPIADLPGLVASSVSGLREYLNVPFALFGHSLGALVSFEMARFLRRHGGPDPVMLLVSGCNAAHLQPGTRLATLPDSVLLNHLRALGGTPADALEHTEFAQLVLPTLRADLAAADCYDYRPGPRLSCPLVAFFGNEDPETDSAAVSSWRTHTTGPFRLHELPGGHFIIWAAARQMTSLIAEELSVAGLS